jgi:hypothetical protein
LFTNLKVITEIYDQSQMNAIFWGFLYCVPIFYFFMTLKIEIFPFFVLFSCKNVKQEDPDQFFRDMSHLKAHNLFKFLALLLYVDHEFRLNPCPAFCALYVLMLKQKLAKHNKSGDMYWSLMHS